MNTPNRTVHLDPENLRRPLETLQPMQLCAYTLKILGAPQDAQDMKVMVMKQDGSHFSAVPCTQDGNGDWSCDLIGALFPTAGETKYQIGMSDADGKQFAGGVGRVMVEPFEPFAGGTVTPEGAIILTEIPDDSGNSHRIKAVKVDGEWTWRMED